jgi:DNA-directed RNA polymerase subunit RPC12/RpoP
VNNVTNNFKGIRVSDIIDSAERFCPHCGKVIRSFGAIQAGREAAQIYKCSGCKREFVEEELRRK